MHKLTETLPSIVYAAGGKVVGKIRIQKIVYLLEQLGLGAETNFSYHHYGPYAEEISSALDYSELIDNSIEETVDQTAAGYSYSIYSLGANAQVGENVGNIARPEAERLLSFMTSETSINIELAATIHWLKHKENISDWKQELVRRKPTKASPQNIERALKLLSDIGLA